jgi:NADH-quinone oxidoreductase subunit K
MHVVIPYVIAALLFGLGVYGVLRRRNAILVLMAVELMLNAVNLIFVAADSTYRQTLTGVQPEAWSHAAPEPRSGSIFALFVIVLAAAEVGVGLAIILQFYRLRKAIAIDDIALHEADDHEADREADHEADGETGDETDGHEATGHHTNGHDTNGHDAGDPEQVTT